jgi:hypothetical protein
MPYTAITVAVVAYETGSAFSAEMEAVFVITVPLRVPAACAGEYAASRKTNANAAADKQNVFFVADMFFIKIFSIPFQTAVSAI